MGTKFVKIFIMISWFTIFSNLIEGSKNILFPFLFFLDFLFKFLCYIWFTFLFNFIKNIFNLLLRTDCLDNLFRYYF